MSRKFRLLFLIATLVLIPILLGTTPINLFQKLSMPCPSQTTKVIRDVTPEDEERLEKGSSYI